MDAGYRMSHRAFTLVEILIVVVILGILGAMVIPRFTNAADDAARESTLYELGKIRKHVTMYRVRNNGEFPAVAAGDGTWGPLVGNVGEHLKDPPINAWVGGTNAKVIVFGAGPDVSYHTNYGWIYDPATGDVWAAGFDGEDMPFARN